jgi:DTW domain-containing protein YfiP/GNAT superfamily N-acetyltransferase
MRIITFLYLQVVVNALTRHSVVPTANSSLLSIRLRSTGGDGSINETKDVCLQNETKMKRCYHPYDANLNSFYRFNFHKKRNKKRVPSFPMEDDDNDAIYTLCLPPSNIILASLRLTRSQLDSKYTFLRSLCVSRDYRGQGLSLKLLEESLQDFQAECCYCFASPYLQSLYQRAGFLRIPKNEMDFSMPKWLIHSFKSMDAQWSRKTLGLFVKIPISSKKNNIQIVLLQHGLEFSKKTATGWLLSDELYYQKYDLSSSSENEATNIQLSDHIDFQRWVWSGRDDTERVEARLESLAKTEQVFLLWTGGMSRSDVIEQGEPSISPESMTTTYIILDGTWQQAKTMYQRISELWTLPKVSLTNVTPSAYVLQKDYSGWKDKFRKIINARNDLKDQECNLLCTAEVAAAVLDLNGHKEVADVIRGRLDKFQTDFLELREGESFK